MDITSNEVFEETISTAEYELIEAIRNYSKAFIQSANENGGVPTINQIEKMWSKLKAFLRKEKIRMASELPSAISKGFLTIRPTDCIGWFHSCNYVQ